MNIAVSHVGGGSRPPRGVLIGRSGQGAGPITPHKKPPGGELTAKQKAYNYSVKRLRAAVERAVSHLKNWKILKTNFPDMLRTVTALEIFRTTAPGFERPSGALSPCSEVQIST